MELNQIPITERSNPKSENIDILDAEGIFKTISKCESEIFGGYQDYLGIYESRFIDNCVVFIDRLYEEIRKKRKVDVVLIGAGTSGRLCRLMPKILSPVLMNKVHIVPIIAGDIKALVKAEPNTEDKPERGAADYLSYTANIDRSKCFVVGVSCGLSANYVVGALNEANKYSKSKTSIIGFNPIELATTIIGPEILVLNPIIGPEAIVGSVRMKGGTTTMILIYSLLMSAINTEDRSSRKELVQNFLECEKNISNVKEYQKEIALIVMRAKEALLVGGGLYILGSSDYGVLTIYDAAECPPTFGARIDQVNGFTQNGINDLTYFEGEGIEKLAKEISMEVFKTQILPKLTESDLVLTIGDDIDRLFANEFVDGKFGNLVKIEIAQKSNFNKSKGKNLISINENWKDKFQKMLFVRSLLLLVSTGSFVLGGKVYENKMIDLRITNQKLFKRAIRIVSQITHAGEGVVKEALLRSIYEGQEYTLDLLEEHISISATREHIVPLTILALIYPEKTIEEIKKMLKAEPIVRKLIFNNLTQSG